jgi:probable phosphoglycerate mutase
MRIILIRHGQTDGNKNEILQGWFDLELNETGVRQAKLLAERLKNEKIDVFYSSDLKRAIMTTEEIKKYHPSKPWIKTPLLRERNFGLFERIAIKKYHKVINSYRLEDYEFRPPFGESYHDVMKRARIFFKEIWWKHKNQNVAVIAHGTFNRVFISSLLGMSFKDCIKIEQENTCLNIIEVGSKPKLIALNDFSHLNSNSTKY